VSQVRRKWFPGMHRTTCGRMRNERSGLWSSSRAARKEGHQGQSPQHGRADDRRGTGVADSQLAATSQRQQQSLYVFTPVSAPAVAVTARCLLHLLLLAMPKTILQVSISHHCRPGLILFEYSSTAKPMNALELAQEPPLSFNALPSRTPTSANMRQIRPLALAGLVYSTCP
jgi:hypothetical protein